VHNFRSGHLNRRRHSLATKPAPVRRGGLCHSAILTSSAWARLMNGGSTMLRALSAITVASALAFAAPSTQAQTFTPSGPVTGSGTITFGPWICNVNVSGSATPTSLPIATRSISGGTVCAGALLPKGSWSVKPLTTSTVELTIGFSTLPASCHGTIVANWSNVTRRITFTDVDIMPPVGAGCTYSGSIYFPALQIL
jgi:hypothetical protein